MARSTARVLTLLELLQGGGLRTVRELAGRLGVDERTVRRDVGRIGELGVPVESVRGRYGGYRIAAGSALPPLMLTDDEALAVVVALASSPGSVAAETASSKIRRVLPAALADRLAALLAAAHIPASTAAPDRAAVLLAAADAVAKRAPLSFRYRDRAERGSRRTVLPSGLVAREGRWYLTGLDSLSGDERTFRVDRMSEPAVGTGGFEAATGTDPEVLVRRAIANGPWRHAVAFRVRAAPDVVSARLPVALLTTEEDGWMRAELRAEHLDWVAAAIASLDAPFEVEHPAELVRELQRFTGRLRARLPPRSREPEH